MVSSVGLEMDFEVVAVGLLVGEDTWSLECGLLVLEEGMEGSLVKESLVEN